MVITALHQWAGVALLGLAATDDDPPVVGERATLAFQFDVEPSRDLWSAAAIIGNWKHRLNERYWRSANAGTATRGHTDNLRTWIATTRAIAEDLRRVYGDTLASVLQGAATAAEETIGWLELRTVDPPRDAQARANLLLAVDLWAFDRVRDVLMAGRQRVPGVPGRDEGRTKILEPVINALSDAGLPVPTSDLTLRSRVNRVRVRPGHEDALIADVLSACRVGPHDRDGQLQPPEKDTPTH